MPIIKNLRRFKRFLFRVNSLKLSKEDLYRSLENIEFPGEPSIYISTSFSQMGNYLGGPNLFYNDLINYFQSEATISFPGHLNPIKMLSPNYKIDLRSEKPNTGILPYLCLKSKTSFRSSHPFGSTLSVGKHSNWITNSHEEDPRLCHPKSPFKKLTDMKTILIGIGTDFSVNAFYHVIEDCISDYPLIVYKEICKSISYVDQMGENIERPVYIYDPELSKYRIEKYGGEKTREDLKFFLQFRGVLTYFFLGEAICWMIKSDLLYEALQDWLSMGKTIYGELDSHFLIPFLKK